MAELIEVVGPAGRIVIPLADLDRYAAQGYEPVEAPAEEPEAEEAEEPEVFDG